MEVGIVFIGLVGTILLVILREERPEIAVLLSIVLGIIIFLAVFERISQVVAVLTDLAFHANVSHTYIVIVLRVIGIAYLVEFGSHIAKDADCEALATKIEFAGKILILTVSIPILLAIVESVLRLLP